MSTPAFSPSQWCTTAPQPPRGKTYQLTIFRLEKYPTIQLITADLSSIFTEGSPRRSWLGWVSRLSCNVVYSPADPPVSGSTSAVEAISTKHVLYQFGKTVKKALNPLYSVECGERAEAYSVRVCAVLARVGSSDRHRCWVLLWVCFYRMAVNGPAYPLTVALNSLLLHLGLSWSPPLFRAILCVTVHAQLHLALKWFVLVYLKHSVSVSGVTGRISWAARQ